MGSNEEGDIADLEGFGVGISDPLKILSGPKEE